MGIRAEKLRKGDISDAAPVKRAINAAVSDTAIRWRAFCKAVISGDKQRALLLLRTSTFGPLQLTEDGPRMLGPLLQWFLKGKSYGRSEAYQDTTYAEDAVLSCLSAVISRLIHAEVRKDDEGRWKGPYQHDYGS
jgi:hypothetical protein